MTSEWKAVSTLDIERAVDLLISRIQNAVVDARTRQSFTGGRPEPSTGKVALTAEILADLCAAKASNDLFNRMKESKVF